MDREKVIKVAEEILAYVLPDEKDTSGIMVKVGWIRDVLSLLKEQQERIENLEQEIRDKNERLKERKEQVNTMLKEQEAVEPKTGHWIWLQFCANEGVYCSECHTKMFDRYPMKKKLSQFCGHCGAKMEGR